MGSLWLSVQPNAMSTQAIEFFTMPRSDVLQDHLHRHRGRLGLQLHQASWRFRRLKGQGFPYLRADACLFRMTTSATLRRM